MSTKLALILFYALTSAFGRKGFGPTDQKWGYVNVREGAHMFWWLHHTTANVSSFTERPLVIWLEGGPGSSSTGYMNFAAIGPLDQILGKRPNAWTNDVNVLFVDNPVGAGFSYVDHNDYLVRNNTQIANDFLVLVKEFFKENPEFANTPLYIVTQSYGGKMTVEIALTIDKATKAGELSCNLTGIALGDSWISPVDTIQNYAPYLLNLGLIDKIAYNKIVKAAKKANHFVYDGKYHEAFVQWENMLSLIKETTHGDFEFKYNVMNPIYIGNFRKGTVLEKKLDESFDDIMNKDVKRALGLNSTWHSLNDDVYNALEDDMLTPVIHIVEELLNTTNIKVAVYNGQLDLIVDTPGTVAWIDKLKWSQKSAWDSVSQQPLVNKGFIEGFYKKVGNLAFYLVERAGHLVPEDNPNAMQAILKDVTGNYIV